VALAETALHLEERPAAREPRVRLEPLDRDTIDVPELCEERASSQRQRFAVFPGQRDRDLRMRGELPNQLQLLDRQIVEAVEEDGP